MVGEIAEDFTLKDQYGNIFNLYENLDENILLVFYPKDDSPVCSMQLSNYQKEHQLLKKSGIKVIGINTNSEKSHKSFCNKLSLQFPLLSDKTKNVSKQFNALNIFGINKRKLVLINRNKKIEFEKTVLPNRYLPASIIIKLVKQLI
jgi:peroxiredoxin Q/BCP